MLDLSSCLIFVMLELTYWIQKIPNLCCMNFITILISFLIYIYYHNFQRWILH